MAVGLVHCPPGPKKVYKEMLFKIFLDINKLFFEKRKPKPNQNKTRHVDELSVNKKKQKDSDFLSKTGLSMKGGKHPGVKIGLRFC